jgi:hypothetical protein
MTMKFPRGIRNKNPGNLRGSVSPDYRCKMEDGFAVFGSHAVGIAELLDLIHVYYDLHDLKTVWEFISRYAPANENDVLSYCNMVAFRMAIPPSKIRTHDMRLDSVWHAMDLCRAIIHVENGLPPDDWPTTPEWYSPHIILTGFELANFWDDAIWFDINTGEVAHDKP